MKNVIKALLVLVALGFTACGQGPMGPAGANGSNGAQGVAGLTGPQGAPGPEGATGQAGANGTSVVNVQFCPGYAESYPNLFPEYGIKFGTQIYAILDQSNGYDYYTLLAPGAYSSAATGAACNFTINADGSITQD